MRFRTIKAFVVVVATLTAPTAIADVAFAMDERGLLFISSNKTLDGARKQVLDYCKKEGKGKCTVEATSKRGTYGHAAAASSKTRVGYVSGYATKAKAERAAITQCAEKTAANDVCQVVLSMYDNVNAPQVAATSDGVLEEGKGPIDANGDGIIQSSTNCVNADCVRVFENGRKVRFQAPHCFDTLKQRWEFKPDGC